MWRSSPSRDHRQHRRSPLRAGEHRRSPLLAGERCRPPPPPPSFHPASLLHAPPLGEGRRSSSALLPPCLPASCAATGRVAGACPLQIPPASLDKAQTAGRRRRCCKDASAGATCGMRTLGETRGMRAPGLAPPVTARRSR
jgi:hypothetical protein